MRRRVNWAFKLRCMYGYILYNKRIPHRALIAWHNTTILPVSIRSTTWTTAHAIWHGLVWPGQCTNCPAIQFNCSNQLSVDTIILTISESKPCNTHLWLYNHLTIVSITPIFITLLLLLLFPRKTTRHSLRGKCE